MRSTVRSRSGYWSIAALGLAAALLLASSGGISHARSAPQLGTRDRCRVYRGLPEGFERDPHAGMVRIAGGLLEPGSDQGYPEERGGQPTQVKSFWIDRTEVTNAQFARFVEVTGYVTEAERRGSAPVFHAPSERELDEGGAYAWWSDVAGASWRHPEGPRSSVRGRESHPVVQVSHADALAYARWLGRTLPSELEWEYAAKAGRDDETLHHEPRDARGRPLANFWQGEFPTKNSGEDGFRTSAPVGCFAANPYGLHDMLGNVWEWTGSVYASSHRQEDRDDAVLALEQKAQRPAASEVACSAPAAQGARLVLKGGSFLCAASFCARYRVSARHAQEAEQAAMHIGFRTVRAD